MVITTKKSTNTTKKSTNTTKKSTIINQGRNNHFFDECEFNELLKKIHVSANVYSVLDEEDNDTETREISSNLSGFTTSPDIITGPPVVMGSMGPEYIIIMGWDLVDGAFHPVITCDRNENVGWVQVKPRKKKPHSKNNTQNNTIIIYGQEKYFQQEEDENIRSEHNPDDTDSDQGEDSEYYENDADYYQDHYGLPPDHEDSYSDNEYDSYGELCRNY